MLLCVENAMQRNLTTSELLRAHRIDRISEVLEKNAGRMHGDRNLAGDERADEITTPAEFADC